MQGNIIFYTTGCPKCAILKKKLDGAYIQYTTVTDISAMQSLGLLEAPALSVDGRIMGFVDAVHWVNEYVAERKPAG